MTIATVGRGPKVSRDEKGEECFGEWLKTARETARMTQVDLADAARVSQSYVSAIERGINPRPDRRFVLAFARALGRPIGEALRAAGDDELAERINDGHAPARVLVRGEPFTIWLGEDDGAFEVTADDPLHDILQGYAQGRKKSGAPGKEGSTAGGRN